MRKATFSCLSAILCGLVVAACGPHLPPTSSPAPILYIKDNLPAETRICVVRNPWHDGTLVCVTIAEIRTMARGQREIALEARR